MPAALLNTETAITDRSALDVALAFARAGMPIFPCHEASVEEFDSQAGQYVNKPEKSPYLSNGLHGASTNLGLVERWFNRLPTALVALRTGSDAGIWALDLDRHGDRDGHLWMAEMEALHGPLPNTARVRTANNGTHIFFNFVEGVRNKAAIAPGVDSRGEAGYVIAAGSVMADGRRYDWVNRDGSPLADQTILPEFADAPAWLLELVLPKPEVESPVRAYTYRPAADIEPYVERAVSEELSQLASTSQGGRGEAVNRSAFSLGTLVGAGVLSRGEAEIGLFDAAYANGVVGKDGEKEIRRKIKRGLDAGIKQPRQIPDVAANDNTPPVDPASIKRMIENGAAKRGEVEEKRPVPVAAQPAGLDIFAWKSSRYVGEPAPVDYLVEGVIESGIPGMIAAMGELGKSYTMLELCRRVAFGSSVMATPLLGGQVVKQGTAVFLTGEDDERSIHRRIAAIDPKQGRFTERGDKLIAIPLPSAVGSIQPFWVEERGTFKPTDSWHRFTDQLSGISDLRVVVVDPLQMFAALPVNDDPAAGQFVCSQIAGLAAHTGANVFFAHHMKKSSGKERVASLADARDAIRGTSALVDGVRVAYALWYPEESVGKSEAKAIGVEYLPNTIVHGGVVKANGASRRLMSTYARNASGLLIDRTALAMTVESSSGDLKSALVIAIEAAAQVGQPFTKTGMSGLYAMKERLPIELRGLSRHRIEALCAACTEDGSVVACIGKGSTTAKWLDVPGGPFAIGLGEFKRGATYLKSS